MISFYDTEKEAKLGPETRAIVQAVPSGSVAVGNVYIKLLPSNAF